MLSLWRRKSEPVPKRHRSAEEMRAAARLDGAKRSLVDFATRLADELAERIADETTQPRPLKRKRRTMEAAPAPQPKRKEPDVFPLHDARLSPRGPMTQESFRALHQNAQRRVLFNNLGPGTSMADIERARKILEATPQHLCTRVREEILARTKKETTS